MGSINPNVLVLLKTRITSQGSHFIMNELCFFMHEFVKGNSFMGGIWMGWKIYNMDIDIIINNFQFIHFKIKIQNGGTFYLL